MDIQFKSYHSFAYAAVKAELNSILKERSSLNENHQDIVCNILSGDSIVTSNMDIR